MKLADDDAEDHTSAVATTTTARAPASLPGEDKAEAEAEAMSELHTRDGSLDYRGRPALKARTGSWKAATFVIGIEGLYSLGYYGATTNLVVYLTKVLHEGNATAAKNVSNWNGTGSILPLLGAFLADAYWGRFWTSSIFSLVYLLGMVLLTLSTLLSALRPPKCIELACHPATTLQSALFYLFLYVMTIGVAGFQPCLTAFGADQFDEEDTEEQKKQGSYFNWFYLSINVGALLASTLIVYLEESIDWGLGFGISTAAVFICVLLWFGGIPFYRHRKSGGNPLSRVSQVVIATVRKRHLQLPSNSDMLYEVPDKESAIEGSRKILHTNRFTFLDKAAIETELDKAGIDHVSPWRLCTVTQVEEVKFLIQITPIWVTNIIFSTVYTQMSSLFIEQGGLMNTRMGNITIPPAAISSFDTISVIFWVPMYDRIIVPLVRRYTGNKKGFTYLQRIGIGLGISALSMVAAALVEVKRLKLAVKYGLLDHPEIPVPMSVFWQAPQYFIVGASEIFTYIGQMEFFYDEAPDAIRSLSSAFVGLAAALGNYLSALLVTIVTSVTKRGSSRGWIPNDNLNRGHVDYFFWLLAVLSILNLMVYLVCARRYKYMQRPAA